MDLQGVLEGVLDTTQLPKKLDFRAPKIHKPGLAAKRKAHWNCSALEWLLCSALVSDLSVCQISCTASGLASGLVWSLVWSSL